MGQVISVSGISMEAFLITGTSLTALAGLFVAVRIWANCRYAKKKLDVGDYISIVAIILLAAGFAIIYEAVRLYTSRSRTPSFKTWKRVAIALQLITAASMWTAKAPILILYIRLFSIDKVLKIICYLTLTITAILSTVFAILPLAVRNSGSEYVWMYYWSIESSLAGVVIGAIAVTTDVVILVLPQRSIYKMQLPLHKKVGLVVVFFTGIMAIVASAVALHFKVKLYRGLYDHIAVALICNAIENSIALIVGCTPGIYCFATNFAQSEFLSKIKSVFSQMSLSSQSSGSKVSKNDSGTGGSGRSGGTPYISYSGKRESSHKFGVRESQTSFVPLRDIESGPENGEVPSGGPRTWFENDE